MSTEARPHAALAELARLGCEFTVEVVADGATLDLAHGPTAVAAALTRVEADSLAELGERIWDALAAVYEEGGDEAVGPVGPSRYRGAKAAPLLLLDRLVEAGR